MHLFVLLILCLSHIHGATMGQQIEEINKKYERLMEKNPSRDPGYLEAMRRQKKEEILAVVIRYPDEEDEESTTTQELPKN